MKCLCQAAVVVAPAVLFLLCLGYVHLRARASWRKEVVFWISVAVAFVTVFVFFSLAQLSGSAASPKATLLSKDSSSITLIWWAALALGGAGVAGCLIHWIVRRQSPRSQ